MDWISVKERLPKISYLEDDLYGWYPVLVKSSEIDVYCVAYLLKEQEKNDWNFGELSWELYIPGNGGEIIYREFETFTHWMPIPEGPEENNEVD